MDDNTTIRKAITQTPGDGKSDLSESDLGDRKYGFDVSFTEVIFILISLNQR